MTEKTRNHINYLLGCNFRKKVMVYHDSNCRVLNFPTKNHYRSPSRLSDIADGLDWFVDHYASLSIHSIAFPPLGCGNGGLSWEVVGPLIYEKLHALPIDIEVYAPYGTPVEQCNEDFLKKPSSSSKTVGAIHGPINPTWKLILGAVRGINAHRYSANVGRTMYQNVCYCITRSGVDTGFHFHKGYYGPFSNEAKESITVLANANMLMEKPYGKKIEIFVPDTVRIAREEFSVEEWMAMKKTIELFHCIKSTEQAEITSTVLYAFDQLAKSERRIWDTDVYAYVMDWKPHWKDKEFEVSDAITNLAMMRYIKVEYSGKLMKTLEPYLY